MRCLTYLAVIALIVSAVHAADFPRENVDDQGFQTIFDGKSLKGWHVSTQTGHSNTSMHTSGGRWRLEDGAIVGSQDIPGNGGIIVTDRQFGDFEVIVEMKNDFGPDSGLFLRSNEKGQAYQYMIDYHNDGNLAGIYGEGLSGGIHHRNFDFLDAVTKIKPKDSLVPCPIKSEEWPEFWKHGEWNELRAKIQDNPPRITTWINRVKFMEFTDNEKRHPDTGSIALQVHGGGDYTNQFVRYRNIRIKDLEKISFSDGKEAGADFQIQGEYIGKLGDRPVGVQVIARGDGRFEAVTYFGGLPGAGYDGSEKMKSKFATKNGVTKASGDGWDATLANGVIIVKHGDQTDELKRLHRESPTLAKPAPEGAIVLFNGTNVDHWEPGKMAENGLMGVGTRTKQVFEDYSLHIEFRSPYMPYAFKNGQLRGNSGLYLGDQYECQILDSFGLEGADNECGGIYQNAKPKVNMCFPPLSWQTYDVDFTCAKFSAAGSVIAPARVSIKHNGVLIHDNVSLKPTPGGGRKDQKPGAIFLQDHGDAVRFRNIWVVEKK